MLLASAVRCLSLHTRNPSDQRRDRRSPTATAQHFQDSTLPLHVRSYSLVLMTTISVYIHLFTLHILINALAGCVVTGVEHLKRLPSWDLVWHGSDGLRFGGAGDITTQPTAAIAS